MATVVSMAEKTGDCRKWSALDALKDCIRDIESGELNAETVYIALKHRVDDETVDYRYLAAGGTNIELSGLLAQHLHRLCIPSKG